jgi:hypothetical protein
MRLDQAGLLLSELPQRNNLGLGLHRGVLQGAPRYLSGRAAAELWAAILSEVLNPDPVYEVF